MGRADWINTRISSTDLQVSALMYSPGLRDSNHVILCRDGVRVVVPPAIRGDLRGIPDLLA